MITPHFSLDQTDAHLILRIHVPHVRVSVQSVEVVVTDGHVVHFCSPPYLLVLNFAGIIGAGASPPSGAGAAGGGGGGPASADSLFADDADEACAQYDPRHDHGSIVVTLAKRVPAHWKDLHLIGQFLAPSSTRTRKKKASASTSRWLREIVVPPKPNREAGEGEDGAELDPHEDEERANVEPPPGSSPTALSVADPPREGGSYGYGYGFAHMFRDVLHHDWSMGGDGGGGTMANEMLEGWGPFWSHYGPPPVLGMDDDEPASWGPDVRSRLRRTRIQAENDAFSPDRYLQDEDVSDDYVYQCAMSMVPHWAVPFVAFTSDEAHQLASIPYPLLPHKLTSHPERAVPRLLLGTVDLLFAYVYDHLTTSGDPTVESAWTIVMLSPSLSWLDDPWTTVDNDAGREAHDPDDPIATDAIRRGLRSSMRRSLVYPYLRNLELSLRCATHVARILAQGRECVIRCLLQARAILHRSDLYYLSNKLYVDPYLAWLQDAPTSRQLANRQASRLSERIDACLLATDWWDEMKLPPIRSTDTACPEAASGDESSDGSCEEHDNSTESSETSASLDDSSEESTGEEKDVEQRARSNVVNPPLSWMMDSSTAASEPPETNCTALPALQTLSLNDGVPSQPSVQPRGPGRRAPLIQELD